MRPAVLKHFFTRCSLSQTAQRAARTAGYNDYGLLFGLIDRHQNGRRLLDRLPLIKSFSRITVFEIASWLEEMKSGRSPLE